MGLPVVGKESMQIHTLEARLTFSCSHVTQALSKSILVFGPTGSQGKAVVEVCSPDVKADLLGPEQVPANRYPFIGQRESPGLD